MGRKDEKTPRLSASYTTSVTRFRFFLLIVSLAAPLLSQTPPPQEPPEEDVSPSQANKEYVLNPLQAEKEIRIGNYYFKKNSYKAAMRRYEEAVKWDPNSAEGWYKLGEAQLKLGNQKEFREAWTKYLNLEPDGKYSATVKKNSTRNPRLAIPPLLSNRRDKFRSPLLPVREQVNVLHIPGDSFGNLTIRKPHRDYENIV